MYCEKCGSQIDDDSVFCQKCGEKQINSDEKNNNIPVAKKSRPNKKIRNFAICFVPVLVILSILLIIPKIQDNARIQAVAGAWKEISPMRTKYHRGGIEFFKDGTGIDQSFLNVSDPFTWRIRDDTVIVLFPSGDTIQFEISGEFMIERSSRGEAIYRKSSSYY